MTQCKGVRFAPIAEVREYVPSPSSSECTLESDLQDTPPDHKQPLPPFFPPFAPSIQQGAVVLNSVLAGGLIHLPPCDLGGNVDEWLASFPVQAMLAQPVTTPPILSLTVVSHRDIFPWVPTIRPRCEDKDSILTIRDFFLGLRDKLQTPVEPGQFELESKERQATIYQAYRRRTIGQKQSFLRLDFLLGQTKFLSLTATSSGPTVWELHLGH